MNVRAILASHSGIWCAAVCGACLVLILCSVISVPAAQTDTIITEAMYIMSDSETPTFAEAMVLQKAKQMVLKEAVAHVERYTKTRNLDLTSEEGQVIAGGSLRMETLEKHRKLEGDGLR
ncbi:MAG: hypothetical protein ACREIM_11545, partial [Nitrospiraceae bacterium]